MADTVPTAPVATSTPTAAAPTEPAPAGTKDGPPNGGAAAAAADGLAALRTKLGMKPPAAAAPAPAVPATEAKPEVDGAQAASAMARIARADQEVKRGAQKLEDDRKVVIAERAEVAPLKAAREKFKAAATIDDVEKRAETRAAAILEMVGGDDVSFDDLAALTRIIGKGPAPLTEADIDKRVEERLTAKEQAAKDAEKKQIEDRQAKITAGETAQLSVAEKFLESNKDKYKAVLFKGVAEEKYVELMRDGFKATGQVPSPEMIFDYLEQEYRKEALTDLIPVITPPKPPVRTFGASDKRGVAHTEVLVAETEPPKKTVAQKTAEFRSGLRAKMAGKSV